MYNAFLKDINGKPIIQFLNLEFVSGDLPPYFIDVKIIVDIHKHHFNEADAYLAADFVTSINEIEGLLYKGYKKMFFDNVLNGRFALIIEKVGESFDAQIVIKDEEFDIVVDEKIKIEFHQLNDFYLQLKDFHTFLYSLNIFTN
jgi:hypothetical protein